MSEVSTIIKEISESSCTPPVHDDTGRFVYESGRKSPLDKIFADSLILDLPIPELLELNSRLSQLVYHFFLIVTSTG
jgi:hypothetical protein